MKKILSWTIAPFLLSAVSLAQEPPAQKEPQQQEESSPLTVRGCLTKGSQAQQYMVADEDTGKKIAFSASPKLDSYVNQTVEITGRVVNRGGEKAFLPETAKSLAASCKDAPKK